ncbi:MAG: hypothetical protein MUF00_11275 [Gemmatimonadaceae bacterium]|nr:hypothetical protein [Gemmatimonadaceae bacterium]
MRSIAISLIVAVLSGIPYHTGQTQTPTTTIQVDALRPHAPVHTTAIGLRERARLEIRNVNPFVHQYRIRVVQETFTENAIGEFAKVLGVTIALPQPQTTVMFVSGCDDAGVDDDQSVQAKALCVQGERVMTIHGQLTQETEAIATLVKAKGIPIIAKRAALESPSIDSTGLMREADSLATLLDLYLAELLPSSLQAIADRAATFARGVADLNSAAQKAADKYPGNGRIAEFRTDAASLALDTLLFRSAVTQAVQQRDEVAKLAATIKRLKASREMLHIIRDFGPFSDPAALDITVQRSPIGADTVWRTLRTERIEVGGGRRRFGIAVGTTFTSVTTSDYAVLRRFRTPSAQQPGDTVESIITETQRDTRQVLPAVALTARLWNWDTAKDQPGVHLVVATSPRSEQGRMSLDYSLGAAISLLNERVMLGWSAVTVQRRQLVSALSGVSRLPATQATVPTKTSRVIVGAPSLVFRVF